MSKKYFTKYLPVEGEIKEGDKYSCPHKGHGIDLGNGIPHKPKTIICTYPHSGYTCKDCYKIKFFLCSRDIEPGDQVYSDFDNGYLGIAKKKSEGFNFKMIGEISPEATWVKEGDEFDEGEIKIETGFFETIMIKVKCPCCGDFK